MTTRPARYFLPFTILILLSCGDTGTNPDPGPQPRDHMTAPRAVIDRFSDSAGVLFIRDGSNGLPGPNEAVDFDSAPFISLGLGPGGERVRYYNFDVQPTVPKPVYLFFYESNGQSVPGQWSVIDVIPGDEGYTDFWQMFEVYVADDYVINSVTSEQGIVDANLRVVARNVIVNCPVVPEGSTAQRRFGTQQPNLHLGWYKDQSVFYFTFEESNIAPVGGTVPISPIYVTFNINPDQPGGGPPSGFRTETGSDQTHNVLATVPTSPGYSPFWQVNIYDNADFDSVSDLSTAQTATILATNAALVNCPVVWVE